MLILEKLCSSTEESTRSNTQDRSRQSRASYLTQQKQAPHRIKRYLSCLCKSKRSKKRSLRPNSHSITLVIFLTTKFVRISSYSVGALILFWYPWVNFLQFLLKVNSRWWTWSTRGSTSKYRRSRLILTTLTVMCLIKMLLRNNYKVGSNVLQSLQTGHSISSW